MSLVIAELNLIDLRRENLDDGPHLSTQEVLIRNILGERHDIQ
jgi:hypothetical protein